MESDDAEILDRIRHGSSDDYAELVRRNQQQVFTILHRYERDVHFVEDLAQETFIKAWRALDQYDGRAPFQHWLSRIAVRVALDHLRRRKRRSGEIEFSRLGDEALEWLQTDDGPDSLDARQAREILEVAMRDLTAAEQIVITMQYLEGRSVKEIAHLTGSSGVAVRVRALRARGKLRAALQRLERTP